MFKSFAVVLVMMLASVSAFYAPGKIHAAFPSSYYVNPIAMTTKVPMRLTHYSYHHIAASRPARMTMLFNFGKKAAAPAYKVNEGSAVSLLFLG